MKTTKPTPAPTVAPTPTPPVSPTQCTNPLFTSSSFSGSWSNGGYNVKNNVWNTAEGGPQTIYACAWNNWYVVSNQPGAGTDDSVKSYPSSQKLVNIPLSTMNNITSTFNVTTPSGGGAVTPNSKQWNAAYDLWLDDWDTEVMIWNNWTMNWQYWYGVYHGVSVTIGGVSYKAYYNGSDAMWFVRQNVTNSGSQDIAAVLRWAVSQGWLRNTQKVNAIEYGFEVTYTGTPTTFSLNDYGLTIN
jgi:hypothetical protein